MAHCYRICIIKYTVGWVWVFFFQSRRPHLSSKYEGSLYHTFMGFQHVICQAFPTFTDFAGNQQSLGAWTTLGTRYQVKFNIAPKISGSQRTATSTLSGIYVERNEPLEHLEEQCKMEEHFLSLRTIHRFFNHCHEATPTKISPFPPSHSFSQTICPTCNVSRE